MTKKAIGYIRVSTNEQTKEGISLSCQENKIRTYAELEELELVGILKDEGKSGKNLNRPEVKKLIKMIQKKEIDVVVIYKLDRLTRKTKDLLYLVEDVFKETAFVSLTEKIDTTTAAGKFFLTIIGALAQMERELISERTKDALQELKKQGKKLGNPNLIPFGLDKNLKPNGQFKELKEMFKMKKQDLSLETIGVKFGKGKSSIKYILENEIYRGLI